MDFFECLRLRRSIRVFTDQDMSKDAIEKILDVARLAPSAGNIQPWDFIVVRKQEIKQKLAEAALGQGFIEKSSVVIIVCADENGSERGYGDRGKNLYCIQDTAAATTNILLAVCALGLGACWVGAFHENEVRKALRAPANMRPVAIIPIGYPAEKPRQPHKRELKGMVHYETF